MLKYTKLILLCLFFCHAYLPYTAFSQEPEKKSEPHADLWDLALENQKAYIEEITNIAQSLQEKIQVQSKEAQEDATHFSIVLRDFFTLYSTYSHPRILEAVHRDLTREKISLNAILQPIYFNKKSAEDLIKRIDLLQNAMPEDEHNGTALQNYNATLDQAKSGLKLRLRQLEHALLPAQQLLEKIDETLTNIEGKLPALWENLYAQSIFYYTDIHNWENLGSKLQVMLSDTKLRLNLESPHSTSAWLAACSRFLVVIIFGLSLISLTKRMWHPSVSKDVCNQITHAIGWGIAGLAFTLAAFSGQSWSSGENILDTAYKTIFAMGMICFALGQIYFAWGLRRYIHKKNTTTKEGTLTLPCTPPALRSGIIAILAALMLYPNFPPIVQAGLWTSLLIVNRVWQSKRIAPIGLSLEDTLPKLERILIWICLLLILLGFPAYSMVLYISFTAIGTSSQLGLACMQWLYDLNYSHGDDNAKNTWSSFIASLLAPLIFVLILTSVYFWIALIPGGTYFVQTYGQLSVNMGKTSISLWQVLIIINVFFLTRAVVSLGAQFIDKLRLAHTHIDASMLPPLQTVLKYGAWALFTLFVLHNLGMSLQNIIVVAGGLSVGIGFGMQTIVNNFLSGLILIFSRTLQKGDVINVAGLDCTVRKISIRATTVETFDNAVIYVPNSEFVANRLINWTRNSRKVRSEIAVGVAYGTDTELVIKLLNEVAAKHSQVLEYPEPHVIFNDFGSSTLDFLLRFWVNDYNARILTTSSLRLAIEKTFRENNIEISFPQMDIHIKDIAR